MLQRLDRHTPLPVWYYYYMRNTKICQVSTKILRPLPLFLKWGIRFGEPYEVPEQEARQVAYVDRFELEQEIVRRRDDEEEDSWDISLKFMGKICRIEQRPCICT